MKIWIPNYLTNILCSIIFQARGLSINMGHVLIVKGAPCSFPLTASFIFWYASSWLRQVGQWPSSKSTWTPWMSALRADTKWAVFEADTSPKSRCLFLKIWFPSYYLHTRSSVKEFPVLWQQKEMCGCHGFFFFWGFRWITPGESHMLLS